MPRRGLQIHSNYEHRWTWNLGKFRDVELFVDTMLSVTLEMK